VAGTRAFGNLVYEARDIKPVVAFGDSMMASAAYWIGSAAQQIIVEETAEVGSIGVVMVHYDWSKEDEMMGLKRTVLSAGKYKALGNDAEPLSDLAKEVFQSELDYIYTMFVDTIAKNRGVGVDYVLEHMADGRVFIGQQAVDAGLADMTGSFEEALSAAKSMVKNDAPMVSYLSTKTTKKEAETMEFKTIQELKKAYPELCDKLIEEGAAGVNKEDIRKKAAEDERGRILGLAAVQFGQDGEKFKAIVDSGVTVEQFKAIQATLPAQPDPDGAESAAVQAAKDQMLDALHQGSPENPGANNGVQNNEKNFMTMVKEYQSVHKCGRVAAMQEVMKEHPEAHAAYLKSVN
jgi:signal peptide peptidase SppA